MSIYISRFGDLYSATVNPPHSREFWSSPEPMTDSKLIEALHNVGCHTTDITDALHEADRLWENRVKSD